MLRRICEVSRAVIVHNPAAAAMVQHHASGANVAEIPMLFEQGEAVSGAEIEATRAQLRVDRRTLLFGIFGHLRESKRVLPVLRAFRRAASERAALLLAGDSGSQDLERAIEPYLCDRRIRRLPYLPDAEFRRLGNATDVCINLRYPGAGETSAIAVAFMGMGKAVLVTDSDEVSRLPQSACIRIAPGITEEASVEEVMRWLVAMPQHARDIGALAQQHIAANHDPERVADLYWQTLLNARS
jgi:glycosyltransferase involved in cell wall biosynthesis